MCNYEVVGNFDISKYDKDVSSNNKIVILTNERREHINLRHPEVMGYIDNLKDILENPDQVYKDNYRKDTYWVVKNFEKNVKVTIKINTNRDDRYMNSIIQMQFMRNKDVNRNINNKKITKIFDKYC